MSALTIIDLETLVGPLEPIPCEHSDHERTKNFHDDGPATHYRNGQCPSCLTDIPTAAICERFTNYIRWNGVMQCDCGYQDLASEFVCILGPITTTA